MVTTRYSRVAMLVALMLALTLGMTLATTATEVLTKTPVAEATHKTVGDELVFGAPPGAAHVGKYFEATGDTDEKGLHNAHGDLGPDDAHWACKREAARGPGAVEGGGLFAPGLDPNAPDPLADQRFGAYVFDAPIVSVTHGTGHIWACGSLGPDAHVGIGAACGSSSSTGIALIEFPGSLVDPRVVTIKANYAWAQSVVGTLPIIGVWWEPDKDGTAKGQGHDKDDPQGILQGTVQAQGGAGCFDIVEDKDDSTGATEFMVSGELTLIPD